MLSTLVERRLKHGKWYSLIDKVTGEPLWTTLSSKEQGYCPPTIITAGGRRQLILVKPDSVNSVGPETGELFWSVPYAATSGSVIMSPIQFEDYLYVAGYSNKNLLLKLDANAPGAQVVWRDQRKKAISPVNVQPFLEDDFLYGFDQNGTLYGVELKTGRRVWATNEPLSSKRPVGSGTAFIVKQGERIWMFNELGEVIIAKMSPEGYTEVDRAKVIEPSNVAFGRRVVWSAPAWANKKVFVRNDSECIGIDLAAE